MSFNYEGLFPISVVEEASSVPEIPVLSQPPPTLPRSWRRLRWGASNDESARDSIVNVRLDPGPQTATDNLSNITTEELLNKLWKSLECPVCLDVPLPPITQCNGGHHICQNCKPRLTECPLCKEYFTDRRIYTVESVVECIPLPCKFRVEGCFFISLHTNKAEHEKNCDFRPFSCCVEGCEALLFSHQMRNHFSSIHGESNVFSGVQYAEEWKFEFTLTDEKESKLFEIPEWGLYTFKAKSLNNNVYFILQAVTLQAKAQQFAFDVFLNFGDHRRIGFSSPIGSLHLSEEKICEDHDCLILSNVLRHKYIRNAFKFSLCIRKISY